METLTIPECGRAHRLRSIDALAVLMPRPALAYGLVAMLGELGADLLPWASVMLADMLDEYQLASLIARGIRLDAALSAIAGTGTDLRLIRDACVGMALSLSPWQLACASVCLVDNLADRMLQLDGAPQQLDRVPRPCGLRCPGCR